ncbi:zinc ion binding [Cyanidiococcus yangmingshanensis]|uniref:RING-type E3 ubiquitin transferase n=1 Tax=Cyanidiococcus yangmingshanensis TaxID=2690220 RepID=A0A7J7ICG8_9RHOD|nr:zinc ion binding [Cyanidiococcus yangmingshanensis]
MNGTNRYMILSYSVFGLILCHAWFTQPSFYRATAYLYNSKTARFAAANTGIASLFLLGRSLQRLFLGELRLVEVERLHLRAREALVEMFLAMTVFSRTDFHARFLSMFAWTFFLKVFHWLSQERLGYVEQQVIVISRPRLTHLRLVMLFVWLLVTDSYMLWHCLSFTSTHGPSIMAMFAFEYAILLIGLLSHLIRYVLFVIDVFVLTEGTWDDKGIWLFYNELLSLFLQLAAYLAFFTYVHLFYSLPLHILRDLAVTARTFRQRLVEFIRYRQVVRSMHTQFPNATDQELAAGDRTCIICREEMFGGAGAKKLVCGHIFHLRCLRSWMERSMSCPTCRRDIRPQRAPSRSASSSPTPGVVAGLGAQPRSEAPDRPALGQDPAPGSVRATSTATTTTEGEAFHTTAPMNEQPRSEPSPESRSAATSTARNIRNRAPLPSALHPWPLPTTPDLAPPPPPPQLLAVLEQLAQATPAERDSYASFSTPEGTLPARRMHTPHSRPRSATLQDARRLQQQLDDLSHVMHNLIERLEYELDDTESQ